MPSKIKTEQPDELIPLEKPAENVPEKKVNKWLNHVKDYRTNNSDKSYKECLKLAKDTYKK